MTKRVSFIQSLLADPEKHPEAARNQIDGHFYDPELERFFRWISVRVR